MLAVTGVDEAVQRFGRTPSLRTNIILDRLLNEVLGLSFSQVYATNIFPFIKPGGISAPIPPRDVLRAALEFVKPELEIVNPSLILTLGVVPGRILAKLGVQCIQLPHPAARIGGYERHCQIWKKRL